MRGSCTCTCGEADDEPLAPTLGIALTAVALLPGEDKTDAAAAAAVAAAAAAAAAAADAPSGVRRTVGLASAGAMVAPAMEMERVR